MLVAGLQPQHPEVVGQTTERRRVAAAVVVDDDHHRPAGRRDVVQRLPTHPAGERAVADHGHHMPVAVSGQLEGLGQPVGIRQRCAGVARLDPVVLALGPRRITGQATLFAQGFEVRGAAGQHLVHVGLMPGVEDDRVVRRIEHPVQRERQLDDAEIGPEVAAGCGDFVNQKVANLVGQILQFRLRKVLQIGGATDLFEHFASVRTTAGPTPRPAEMPEMTPENDRRRTAASQVSLLTLCPGEPGSLVGIVLSCDSGLPVIRGYSGVHDELHGRRDRAERADIRLGGVTRTSRAAQFVSAPSPPMLSQAGARRQDCR